MHNTLTHSSDFFFFFFGPQNTLKPRTALKVLKQYYCEFYKD